jgi:hypothetical protein
MARSLAKDARRDAGTVSTRLRGERKVFRYVSKPTAAKELRFGISSGRHMTAHTGPGRPLKGLTAMRRYGLPERPEVRETVRLPKSFPARFNRALGGSPGVGEITSPARVPRKSITREIRLR